jgi:hypothetical protein
MQELALIHTSLPPVMHTRLPTWRVYDGQVGAVLVLDAHDDLPGPELLLGLQAVVLGFNIVLKQCIVNEPQCAEWRTVFFFCYQSDTMQT